MNELSTYRRRVGLFAYTAYKKSSQGRKPKQRQRQLGPATKRTSKLHSITDVNEAPERNHCTLVLILLLVSFACSIERYGFLSESSCLTSVDWLTGNNLLVLRHGCNYPGNCYYRSTISSKQNSQVAPILGITGVFTLESFASIYKQNHLSSSLQYKEMYNPSDITSPVNEERVFTINSSANNNTMLNTSDLTTPLRDEPVRTLYYCDHYAVNEEPVLTVTPHDNYTVFNYRYITSPESEEPLCINNPVSGTCSYLLGNSGCHTYNGNPGNTAATEQDMRSDLAEIKEDMMDDLARRVAVLGTSEAVYTQDTAAPIQHKMPPVDMELYVKRWKEDDNFCYVTKGVTHVVQKISSDEVCFHCVVGMPASGKSTAIRHAALHLKESLGFNIYIITKPEEFFTYLNKEIKQIFLFDDVIGECFVDEGMLRLWDKHNDRIKRCLDKNTKILSTMRVQIYLDQKPKGKKYIFNSEHNVTNLSDEIFRLNVSEMKNMLHLHLKINQVANIVELIEDIWPSLQSESTAGQDFDKHFPLMCKVFSENDYVRVKPRKYFSNPLPILQNLFQQIKDNNKSQFCGLLLCGIMELNDEYFSPLCKLNKPQQFDSIIESLDLDPQKDLLKIKEALQALDGVYISHIGNRYTFIHSFFQNIITYLFDDKYYIFRYATRHFITSHVRLFVKLDTDDQYVFIYGEECVDLLVNRMIHELKSSGDTYMAAEFIVYNCNINNETLISCLITQLYDLQDVFITRRMTDWLFDVAMTTVCQYTRSHPNTDVTSCPQYQLLASLITKHDCSRQMLRGWGWWKYPLLVSVVCGVLPVTKLFLTKPEVNPDVTDVDNTCILHWAVRCGDNNVDMTKFLLSLPNLNCLNYRDRQGHTPYWWAMNNTDISHKQELIKLYKDKGAICE